MKVVVVFYSYEGNTRLIAEAMAGTVNAELVELKPKHEKRRRGIAKLWWGGKQVLLAKEPELAPLDVDWNVMDLVLIGTPVWAGSYAPALRTFFSSVDLKGKQVGLFCCHAGCKGAVFRKMEDRLQGCDVLGRFDVVEPLKKGRDRKVREADAWAADMVDKA